MYLKEVDGIFTDEITYKTISDNNKPNDLTIMITNKSIKELQLYDLEYIESICTAEEFNNLLESIKLIWELEYPDYTIKYWRTKSNKLFLKWLGVENFKNYC